MKKFSTFIFWGLLLLLQISSVQSNPIDSYAEKNSSASYVAEWLVIGGGAAGIASVASLRDARVKPQDIVWVDPDFSVGALGKYYQNVPANSARSALLSFFTLSPTLKKYSNTYKSLEIRRGGEDCILKDAVGPMQTITDQLCKEVGAVRGYIDHLSYDTSKKIWSTQLPHLSIIAKRVILATGSHPKKLIHDSSATVIPLEDALDLEKLSQKLPTKSNIVVTGSAHSAALALKNLVDLGCTNIVHAFRSEFIFTKAYKQGVAFPYSGVRGPIGVWAQQNLMKNVHPAITRVNIASKNYAKLTAPCTVFIDAIGYEANRIPVAPALLYNPSKGPHEIGPNLYGIGIAFPGLAKDSHKNVEHAVGVVAFMTALKTNLPTWMKS